MLTQNIIGIIADDLTGANDTALQFFSKGAATDIILDYKNFPKTNKCVNTFAITTESRNIDAKEAGKRTYEAFLSCRDNLNVDLFYKKIDSTLRGNIAFEILSALEATGYDCAIIAPAFVQEGRITIGGYQMVKNVPIERTEAARDPYMPVYESNIVNILQKQLTPNMQNSVGLIDFNTVSKGAGPITLKINDYIRNGKKFIVVDAASIVDLEQIVLAIKKCSYHTLPVGSAGLAQVLANNWLNDVKSQHIKKTVASMPKLILSGSATQLSALQIKKLEDEDNIENGYFISLKTKDILEGVGDKIVERILSNLVKNNIVGIHVGEISAELEDNSSNARELLIDEGITREEFAHKITEYLSELAIKIKEQRDFILVTVGGETSHKCAQALGCEHLQVVDAILPSIPLCLASNGQLIVTKSGNLGVASTLIEIIKYFERHE